MERYGEDRDGRGPQTFHLKSSPLLNIANKKNSPLGGQANSPVSFIYLFFFFLLLKSAVGKIVILWFHFKEWVEIGEGVTSLTQQLDNLNNGRKERAHLVCCQTVISLFLFFLKWHLATLCFKSCKVRTGAIMTGSSKCFHL